MPPKPSRSRSPAPSFEDRLVDWLRRRATGDRHGLIGDDAALLPEGLAVTVDHQIEGVHFLPGLDPASIGRRLLAVNLSDLAAVGAAPRYAFLALAAPRDFDRRRLLGALVRRCERFGLELAGGDNAEADRLTTSLTVIGARSAGGRWLERSNARAGDRLWVGGWLGASAVGRELLRTGVRATDRGAVELPRALAAPTRLARAARAAVRRHLEPRPQLELGHWLARRRRAAAIDVSDGLALDLHRLCRSSGVGAVVEPGVAPIVPRFEELCRRLELDPLDLVLHGGEDYVLLFALPPRVTPPATFGCQSIGRLHAGAGVRIRDAAGERPLAARGWDHLRPR